MRDELLVPEPTDRIPSWTPGPRTDRARQRLLEGAQVAFLDRGFAGARISDITAAAGLSRATFYVHFPSKHDVFLALGTDAALGGARRLERARSFPAPWNDDDLRSWVTEWFDHLERFGAFERLWRQEAPDDLKQPGLALERRHARQLGVELDRLRGRAAGDPTLQGIAFSAMVEGIWYHHRRAPDLTSRDEALTAIVHAARGTVT